MTIDQARASRLAREGFHLWQAGKLEESLAKYQEAFGFVDPDHYALADYYGEFAAVLASMGRDEEASQQYREAVAVSIRQDPEEKGPGVAVERYFLCELLLKMNRPDQALEAIEPALHGKTPCLPMLCNLTRSGDSAAVGGKNGCRSCTGLGELR